jgi:predicted DNA-binding protein (MmcQ/YjbR family)
MDIDWLREFCLSLRHTTEKLQWEDALVFKIGGKMYAVVSLEPGDGRTWLSFKCSIDNFASLVERPGIIPAPYLARAHWVALENDSAISRDELKSLLQEAYALIVARLPKKTQLTLSQKKAGKKRARRFARRRK